LRFAGTCDGDNAEQDHDLSERVPRPHPYHFRLRDVVVHTPCSNGAHQGCLTQKSGLHTNNLDNISVECGFWLSKTSASWRRFLDQRCKRSTMTSSSLGLVMRGSPVLMRRCSTWSCWT